MTPERWQMVRGILQSAMELRPAERVAFLDRECAADPSLREDVEKYLSVDGKLDAEFLESPAAEQVVMPQPPRPATRSWRPGPALARTSCRRCLEPAEWARFIERAILD